MLSRFCVPFVRDVLKEFRAQRLSAAEAAAQLAVSKRRLYQLYSSFLRAVAARKAGQWSPRSSGGNHQPAWTPEVEQLVRKLLKTRCSYSLIASELLRRLNFKVDRAIIRRFALRHHLAPASPAPRRKPVRRWQTQQIGQLWQYDASPHRWFSGQDWQPSLLHLMDDHSRVIIGARLYERENLLAHLDFLSQSFQSFGLPLCLYVDYHSFFFTHTPEAHTQLAAALRFYGVSLRFAPTPQAKGKIERGHQFWQKRLPPLFAAEQIAELDPANQMLNTLRAHHNEMEKHREIGCPPQKAWNNALAEKRSVLRPTPKCPWWPYVFSLRARVKVASDGKVSVGSQRLRVEVPPDTAVIRCQHPNNNVTVLKEPPHKDALPQVLLSTCLS